MTKKETEATVNKLIPLETGNIDKLVNNYIKSDHDPVLAYKKTFNKQLWKTETIVKVRAETFFNSIEMQEIYEKKLDDLRTVYKDDIDKTFNFLNRIINDETYIHHDAYFDPKLGKAIEYKYKKSIPISEKRRASELLMKIMGYFETNKKDIQVINSQFKVIRKVYEE